MPVTYHQDHRPSTKQWVAANSSFEKSKLAMAYGEISWSAAALSAGAPPPALVDCCTKMVFAAFNKWPVSGQCAEDHAMHIICYAATRYESERGPFLPFFRRVLRGILIDLHRAPDCRRAPPLGAEGKSIEDIPAEPVPLESDECEELSIRLRKQAISNVLNQAIPADRHLFRRRLQGWKYQTIITEPGSPCASWSWNNVKVRYSRLQKRMQVEFKRLLRHHEETEN